MMKKRGRLKEVERWDIPARLEALLFIIQVV
jgi:hypothetical protein